MNIQIKKLTPELLDDFLYFFDHTAFADHEEWAGCYCLESHAQKEWDDEIKDVQIRRERAIELVKIGVMQGYLLYDGDEIAGWCNADDKLNLAPMCADPEFWTEDQEKGKIKVMYCLDIAPEYRGKGLARLVMERVCFDAKEEGYTYVEGYPYIDTEDPYQYKGPLRLYESMGFEVYQKKSWFYIVRKKL